MRLPASKGKNVGQALFSNRVVVQVDAGIEITVSQEVEVTQRTRTARIAVAVPTQPPHKTLPQLSIK